MHSGGWDQSVWTERSVQERSETIQIPYKYVIDSHTSGHRLDTPAARWEDEESEKTMV